MSTEIPVEDAGTASKPEGASAPAASRVALRADVIVIGAGQAGLSSAYHLKKRGLEPGRGFVVLDGSPRAGAWQFRWPSLKLSTVNRTHDLPGMRFSEAVDTDAAEVEASVAVPRYFAAYEKAFGLPVYRPVKVAVVCDRGGRLRIETDRVDFSARGVINATCPWDGVRPGVTRRRPIRGQATAHEGLPDGRGVRRLARDRRRRRHLGDTAARRGLARNHHDLGHRRPPEFRAGPFIEDRGRAAVAMVEDRVRRGPPPNSVVSVTGLPVTPAVEAMRARGVLNRLPMFEEILEGGVRWPDGTVIRADVILLCIGFRSSLDHLAPLMLGEPGGGMTMTGRLATEVAKDPRVHLVGYGPSASTIGANRAGAAAAKELMASLGLA